MMNCSPYTQPLDNLLPLCGLYSLPGMRSSNRKVRPPSIGKWTHWCQYRQPGFPKVHWLHVVQLYYYNLLEINHRPQIILLTRKIASLISRHLQSSQLQMALTRDTHSLHAPGSEAFTSCISRPPEVCARAGVARLMLLEVLTRCHSGYTGARTNATSHLDHQLLYWPVKSARGRDPPLIARPLVTHRDLHQHLRLVVPRQSSPATWRCDRR